MTLTTNGVGHVCEDRHGLDLPEKTVLLGCRCNLQAGTACCSFSINLDHSCGSPLVCVSSDCCCGRSYPQLSLS